MRDLLDMLELDPPQDQDEQDSFQHFSFLYTRYVQICKNLEDRSATCRSSKIWRIATTSMCTRKSALTSKRCSRASWGMLEIQEYLVKMSGF